MPITSWPRAGKATLLINRPVMSKAAAKKLPLLSLQPLTNQFFLPFSNEVSGKVLIAPTAPTKPKPHKNFRRLIIYLSSFTAN